MHFLRWAVYQCRCVCVCVCRCFVFISLYFTFFQFSSPLHRHIHNIYESECMWVSEFLWMIGWPMQVWSYIMKIQWIRFVGCKEKHIVDGWIWVRALALHKCLYRPRAFWLLLLLLLIFLLHFHHHHSLCVSVSLCNACWYFDVFASLHPLMAMNQKTLLELQWNEKR